jgi:transcriptional regulator with XRE-family HTH domain
VTQSSRLRVARNVVTLRHAQNVTQAQLASMSGLDRSYLGSIEQARRNVSIDNIDRIATALGVDSQVLLAAFEPQILADPRRRG